MAAIARGVRFTPGRPVSTLLPWEVPSWSSSDIESLLQTLAWIVREDNPQCSLSLPAEWAWRQIFTPANVQINASVLLARAEFLSLAQGKNQQLESLPTSTYISSSLSRWWLVTKMLTSVQSGAKSRQLRQV